MTNQQGKRPGPNVPVLHGRISAALDRGDYDAAQRVIATCTAQLVEDIADIAFLRSALTRLRGAGRTGETLQLLQKICRLRAGHQALRTDLGQVYQMLGNLDEAERAFGLVLKRHATHAPAWLGQIGVALARQDLALAEQYALAAMRALPDNAVIARKAGPVLARTNRLKEARISLETALELTADKVAGKVGGTRPDAGDPELKLALALVWRRLGLYTAADALAAEILADAPDHARAWTGRVHGALLEGDIDRALDLSRRAIAQLPDHPGLKRMQGEALRRAGRESEALDTLADVHARFPKDSSVAVSLGHAYRRAGQLDKADQLFQEVLTRDAASWPALEGRVDVAEARRDPDGAMRLLLAGPDADAVPEVPELPLPTALPGLETAPRYLRLAEVACAGGRKILAQTALVQIKEMLTGLNDAQVARFLALADRVDQPELAAEAIRQAALRPALKVGLAQKVLFQAHVADDTDLADEVETTLAARVTPDLRPIFIRNATRMRRGPVAALALLRREAKACRTEAEAVALADLLVVCGRARLAVRYLRFCRRRWPNALEVSRSQVNADLMSGQSDAAQARLAALEQAHDDRELEAMWLSYALETGDLERAYRIQTDQLAEGRLKDSNHWVLRTRMALGHMDEAKRSAEAIRKDPEQTTNYAAHFNAMLLGQVFNEFVLCGQSEPDRGKVTVHFHAAKVVLDKWQAATPAIGTDKRTGEGPGEVPRRIFQYWNRDTVPGPVAEIMASWQSRPGWEYRLMNRRGAIDWLRTTLGPRYVQAFTMAKRATEESDFLRLCLLWAEGGIYADADDKLVGTPEELCAFGPGLIAFREPFGAISNNLVCAPAKHPAIARAVKLARAAMLRRDNDITWLRIGPGLLTRAVAMHVYDSPETAAQDVTLVPRVQLRRHVHPHMSLPYKTTPSYWNSGNRAADRLVETALRELVRSCGGN